MALMQDDMGNLIHGVSQQPDERMLKGQLRVQQNCRSHLTKGLSSRAAWRFVSQLAPDTANAAKLNNAKWRSQQRGDGVDFIVAYDQTRPAVFNLLGQRQHFEFATGAQLYYQDGVIDPKQDFGIDSVLDTTYITNRNVIPLGSDNDQILDPPRVTWIEFKTFQPGTEIEIEFDTIAGGYITTVFHGFVEIVSGVPDPAESLRTAEYEGSYHAQAFTAAADSTDVTHYNNWVRIQHPDENQVRIILGGENIQLHENRSISSVEVLPPFAVEGDVCRVDKARNEEQSLGYFEAKSRNIEDLLFAEVAWDETIATGSRGTITSSTMPHIMRRDLANSFILEAIDWIDRQTGDSDTNPYPTFVQEGTPISNVGLFQNRLFLTSKEVVFLSAVDNYYDLWRESAFYNTDADPFEKFADTDELNIIRYAEEMDGDLIFFSSNGQFSMSGEINHTYQTATVASVSQFKTDFSADPVISGDNIFFATDYGNFAGVRELFTDGTDRTKRALPVTQHVDEYIFGNITNMATSTNIDALCCLSTVPDESAVYEWMRDIQGVLQQSSWHKWKLPEGCVFVWQGFIEAKLYAVVLVQEEDKEDPTYMLWNLEWDDSETDIILDFPVLLDGRFFVPTILMEYVPATDTTRWITPYDRLDFIFVELSNSVDPGFEVTARKIGTGVWEADGDLSDVSLIGGLRVTSIIGLANPQKKDSQGASMTLDRLQLAKVYTHFTKVGKMNMEITDLKGNYRKVEYNNRRVGLPINQMSKINTKPDTWDCSIRKKIRGLTLVLTTDDVVPFVIRAIEWRGEYKQKGRR